MTKLTVSILDAVEMLSLSRSTIYEMLDKGELTKVKFGRRTLITTDSIKAAIAQRVCNDASNGEIAA